MVLGVGRSFFNCHETSLPDRTDRTHEESVDPALAAATATSRTLPRSTRSGAPGKMADGAMRSSLFARFKNLPRNDSVGRGSTRAVRVDDSSDIDEHRDARLPRQSPVGRTDVIHRDVNFSTAVLSLLDDTGLSPDHAVTVGGRAVGDLAGHDMRPAANTDLAVTQQFFTRLRAQVLGTEGWSEHRLSDGRALLKGKVRGHGVHVAVDWGRDPGFSTETLRESGYRNDKGLYVVGPHKLLEWKQNRGELRDKNDYDIIKNHLYGTQPLPPELLADQLAFVQRCLPPELRDRPELAVAAKCLYVVLAMFGEQNNFRTYSGTKEPGAMAPAHAWEHSAFGMREGQRNLDELERRRRLAGRPDFRWSDLSRLVPAVSYSGHDVILGHGRMAENPYGHDERRAADWVVAQLEAHGIRDPQLLAAVHAAVMATTFDELRRNHLWVPNQGHMVIRKNNSLSDLISFRKAEGAIIAIDNVVENLTRLSAGFDRPLARLLTEINARESQNGLPLTRITTTEQALALIERNSDYPTRRPDGTESTLLNDFAEGLIRGGNFGKNHDFPRIMVLGSRAAQQRLGDTLIAWGEQLKQRNITPSQAYAIAKDYAVQVRIQHPDDYAAWKDSPTSYADAMHRVHAGLSI